MGGTFLSHSRHTKVLRSPGEDMFAEGVPRILYFAGSTRRQTFRSFSLFILFLLPFFHGPFLRSPSSPCTEAPLSVSSAVPLLVAVPRVDLFLVCLLLSFRSGVSESGALRFFVRLPERSRGSRALPEKLSSLVLFGEVLAMSYRFGSAALSALFVTAGTVSRPKRDASLSLKRCQHFFFVFFVKSQKCVEITPLNRANSKQAYCCVG